MLPLTKRLLYKWYIMQNVRKIGLFGNTFKCLNFQVDSHGFFWLWSHSMVKRTFTFCWLFLAEQRCLWQSNFLQPLRWSRLPKRPPWRDEQRLRTRAVWPEVAWLEGRSAAPGSWKGDRQMSPREWQMSPNLRQLQGEGVDDWQQSAWWCPLMEPLWWLGAVLQFGRSGHQVNFSGSIL